MLSRSTIALVAIFNASLKAGASFPPSNSTTSTPSSTLSTVTGGCGAWSVMNSNGVCTPVSSTTAPNPTMVSTPISSTIVTYTTTDNRGNVTIVTTTLPVWSTTPNPSSSTPSTTPVSTITSCGPIGVSYLLNNACHNCNDGGGGFGPCENGMYSTSTPTPSSSTPPPASTSRPPCGVGGKMGSNGTCVPDYYTTTSPSSTTPVTSTFISMTSCGPFGVSYLNNFACYDCNDGGGGGACTSTTSASAPPASTTRPPCGLGGKMGPNGTCVPDYYTTTPLSSTPTSAAWHYDYICNGMYTTGSSCTTSTPPGGCGAWSVRNSNGVCTPVSSTTAPNPTSISSSSTPTTTPVTSMTSCGPIGVSYLLNYACHNCNDGGGGFGPCENGMITSTTRSKTSTPNPAPSGQIKIIPVLTCSGAATCKPGFGYSTLGFCTQCKIGTSSKGGTSVCVNCPGALFVGMGVCPAVIRVIVPLKATSTTSTTSTICSTGSCSSTNSFTTSLKPTTPASFTTSPSITSKPQSTVTASSSTPNPTTY